MNEYHITWRIDVEADGPLDALDVVKQIWTDPESIANVFEVTGPDGTTATIDLDAMNGIPRWASQRWATGKPPD